MTRFDLGFINKNLLRCQCGEWIGGGDGGSREVIMAAVLVRVDSGLDQSQGITDGEKRRYFGDKQMELTQGTE